MLPFLKWAGGKRWLIPRLKDRLPKFERYFEAFLGSGALYFALEPKSAFLSDNNPELINCYLGVRNRCNDILKILKRLKVTKRDYYIIRDKFNSEKDRIKRAAYFIYLNKTCWNGLYRVNNEGYFNVPIGKHTERDYKVYDQSHLLAVSKLLKKATIQCSDFENAVISANRKSDFVYFDPPYITTHLKNGFIKYNSVLFNQTDELRLAKLAAKLASKNTFVLVSNAAHPLIKEQYNGCFYKEELERASLIAGDPSKRTSFTELLVSNFPINFEAHAEPQADLRHRYVPSYNPKCRL